MAVLCSCIQAQPGPAALLLRPALIDTHPLLFHLAPAAQVNSTEGGAALAGKVTAF